MRNTTLTKETVLKGIKTFINTKTTHKEIITINKGRKSDFCVKVKDKYNKVHAVNFWIYEDILYYGLVNFGISSSMNLNDFKNE
jgi:hypothetical protein